MSNFLKYKQLLAEQIEIESELIDFIKECLKEIFPNVEDNYIIYEFESDVENGREFNGCIQTLNYYKQMAERNAKERKERVKKEAKE